MIYYNYGADIFIHILISNVHHMIYHSTEDLLWGYQGFGLLEN